ncbi:MAG: Sulfur carrier protein ThiS adenylyltransferase [Candidatus Anoxychlamydiales bacterium]|nr:Sulfur carrier protein ThiS adenylyltransferase [Candidatus Anoxychlamydiales bacterium]
MKKVLAPYMKVGFKDNKLYLGFGSIKKIIHDKFEQKLILEILACLKKPTDKSGILKSLMRKYENSEVLSKFVDEIFESPYVIDIGIYKREDRYSRNLLYYNLNKIDPLKVQHALESKHIVILGCGGIGNIASLLLSSLGVRHLTLIDDDKIELSNLNRQFAFCEKDVGFFKTDILKQAILDRNSSIQVDILKMKITTENVNTLPIADLVILSADSNGIVRLINEFSLKNNVPYLNIGYIQDIACWGPFVIPYKTCCFLCQNNLANQESDFELMNLVNLINQKNQVPSNGFVNTLAASFGVLDVVRYLGKFGQVMSYNKRIGLHTDSLKWEEQSWSKNPECVYCKQILEPIS